MRMVQSHFHTSPKAILMLLFYQEYKVGGHLFIHVDSVSHFKVMANLLPRMDQFSSISSQSPLIYYYCIKNKNLKIYCKEGAKVPSISSQRLLWGYYFIKNKKLGVITFLNNVDLMSCSKVMTNLLVRMDQSPFHISPKATDITHLSWIKS